MEQSGVSLETSLHNPLYQDDQLGFDPNVELDEEALDFGHEKTWEEAGHLAETIPASSAVSERGDDYHAQVAAQQHEQIQGGEKEEEDVGAVGEETGAEMPEDQEDQDEIGYDDEAPAAEDLNPGSDDANVGQAGDQPEDHGASTQSLDVNGVSDVVHDADMSWEHDVNAGADIEAHDEPADDVEADDVEADDAEESAEPTEPIDDLAAENIVDETRQREADAARLEQELDEIIEEHSPSPRKIPNIEVIYNDECYSLFGTGDDDPNSYFLSDPEELGDSLSQFLASLRDVISEDLGPTDELVIRLDSLDFEFGERSNDKFLNRSFHEILDCHESLSRASGASPEPVVIQLLVRRDSEEHFLELLSQAERAKQSPGDSEDSEMSDADEHTPVSASDNGGADDQVLDAENSDEYGEEGDIVAADAAEDQPVPEGPGLEEAHGQEDVSDAQVQGVDAAVVTEGPSETHGEEDQEAEAPTEEAPGAVYAEGQAWDEQEPVDDSTDLQHVEVAEATYIEQDNHETNEETGNESNWDDQDVEAHAAVAEQGDVPLELSDQQIDLDQQEQQELDPSHEPVHSTPADEVANQEDGEPEEDEGAHGNFPSFHFASLLRHSTSIPPSGPAQGTSTAQHPSAQPRQVATAVDEEEHWEISFLEDEHSKPLIEPSEDDLPSVEDERLSGAVLEPQWAWVGTRKGFSSPEESEDIPTGLWFGKSADEESFQDDDLILAFDEDLNPQTSPEEGDEYEGNDVTYDVADNLPLAGEDMHGHEEVVEIEYGSSRDIDETSGPATAMAETQSIHTSTTINGDEIDYDEEDAVVSAPAGDGAQQFEAPPEVDDDEIGWENDEDEKEQTPAASGGDIADYELSNTAPQSPPSGSGKRSRPDETESLAEETGMSTPGRQKRTRLY
ncbi:hypothetical protein VTJ49DRAFT_2496 [Mycothermus thermophilus]|uniref:Uncharacterized protein n=1 Tax=Humicola insolens TaxID=85995 RepID=A0ABR3VAE8_HUMIN